MDRRSGLPHPIKISIIIPVLNEGGIIVSTLQSLQSMRKRGHEVIVVDGGSCDDSALLALPYSDQVLVTPRGRARQMNEGAAIATGDIFLFLHADTVLPGKGDQLIETALRRSRRGWGRFDVRLSGAHPLFRVIEFLMNWRSRLSGIATGDQALFVRRELFEKVGGFPPIDLMEDIALSKKLKKYGKPVCLWHKVMTSSRRWEEEGIVRTVVLMWCLRAVYFFGADPKRIVKFYYPGA
jgi:rSAM/selenodomain-associated transferase 2